MSSHQPLRVPVGAVVEVAGLVALEPAVAGYRRSLCQDTPDLCAGTRGAMRASYISFLQGSS
jgi:hypothetical protein